jgi:predicted Zn-dependent protease
LVEGASPRDVRRLRYWRALAYVNMAQYDSALADMNFLLAGARSDEQRFIMRGGDSKEVLEYSIGLLEQARGNGEAAKAAMLRAMVENAGFYAPHAELGRIALAQNNPEEAVNEYSQAAELSGTDGFVRFQYAQALSAAGRHDDAVAEFRRAQELEPYYADIDLHLAVTLEKAGNQPEALVAYRRFVERAPRRNAEQIARVQARIRTIESAPAQ